MSAQETAGRRVLRPPCRHQLSREHGHRGRRSTGAIEQPVGLPPVVGGDELASAGHHKTRQVPVRTVRLDHAHASGELGGERREPPRVVQGRARIVYSSVSSAGVINGRTWAAKARGA
ncbi:MAG: hypothetical protein ACRDRS_07360 [Pseudonocardiaceae bacterium]